MSKGVALKAAGASSVSAFVAHGVFPNKSWYLYYNNIYTTIHLV